MYGVIAIILIIAISAFSEKRFNDGKKYICDKLSFDYWYRDVRGRIEFDPDRRDTTLTKIDYKFELKSVFGQKPNEEQENIFFHICAATKEEIIEKVDSTVDYYLKKLKTRERKRALKNLKGCNNMAKYTLPDFVAHTHGRCELCYEDDVDLFVIPDYLRVCKYCLENNVDICSECGNIWASDAVEFTFTDDDKMICEYCMKEMELE